MKKYFIIFLIILLFLSCVKNETQTAGEKHLVWYSIGTPQKDINIVMQKVNTYLKENLDGASIELNLIDWSDYNTKSQALISSGENFDLIFTSSWTNDYKINVSKGAFLPINDLLEKYGRGIVKVLNPVFLEGTKIHDTNYAVPTNKEMGEQVMFRINKTYLDKYNIDASKINSIDDLGEYLEIIKQNEPDVVPFAVYGNRTYLLDKQDYLISSRIPGMIYTDRKDLRITNQYEDKDFLKEMRKYREYYLKGYIPRNAADIRENSSLEKSGKWFIDLVSYQPGAEVLYEKMLGYKVVLRPLMHRPMISTRSLSGAMIAISSASKKPELAMKFLNLLNTDIYLRNLIDSGIEGKHYEKKGVSVMDDLPDSIAYNMPSFTLGNLFLLYTYPEDPIDKWKEFDRWNRTANVSPILGFVFDPSSVKTELSAIINISEEFGPGLMTGAYDMDEHLGRAMNKFKEAGLDRVLEEMQRQVDHWALNKCE